MTRGESISNHSIKLLLEQGATVNNLDHLKTE